MWKHSKFFYNGPILKGKNFFPNNHDKITGVATKSSNVTETIQDVLPKEARVVICGGGVMGGSVAYHLSLLGLGPETVIVESGR